MLKPSQLQAPRLRLRPATALDLASLQPLWRDASMPRWRAGAQAAELWVITPADGSQDIGCVGLRPSAMAPRLCQGSDEPFEPLLLLYGEHRGRGYAQEAMRAVLFSQSQIRSG
jgi:hypothetical protein